MKEISVIVPCYNVERYIDECLESLIHQTLPLDQMELILVDDASEDGTLERLKAWEEQYPETILIIACEKNGKQGTARNIGISYASGQYIGFVDSDDWVEPRMYEALLEKAEQYQCDMVTCHMFRNKADGSVTREFLEKEDSFVQYEKSAVLGREQWPAEMGGGGVVCKIFRRAFLVENGIYFPEGLCYEDNYFCMLTSVYGKSVYKIEHCYYHYRENEGSTTLSRNSDRLFDRLDIEIMKLEKLKELNLFERFYDEIEQSFFQFYYFNTMFLMATRFDSPPYEVYQRMEKEIQAYFPNWQNDEKLVGTANELHQVLLKVLSYHFSEEKFIWFMRRYAGLSEDS